MFWDSYLREKGHEFTFPIVSIILCVGNLKDSDTIADGIEEEKVHKTQAEIEWQ